MVQSPLPSVALQQMLLMRLWPKGLDFGLGSEIAPNGLTRSTFTRTELTQTITIQNPNLKSDMAEWILAHECMRSYFNTLEDAFKHQPDDPDVSYLMILWSMGASDICPEQRLYADPVWQRLGLSHEAAPGIEWEDRDQVPGKADSHSLMYERYMNYFLTAQLESARPATTGGLRKRAREPSPPFIPPPTERPTKRQHI